jgi:hypothetical protein
MCKPTGYAANGFFCRYSVENASRENIYIK